MRTNAADNGMPNFLGNREVEAAVLGALLTDSSAIEQFCHQLSPEDFYDPQHRVVYRTAVELYQQGTPPDLVTVYHALRSSKGVQTVQASYLASLTQAVPVVANLPYYVNILRRDASQRRRLRLAELLAAELKNGQAEGEEHQILEELLKELSATDTEGAGLPLPVVSAKEFCQTQRETKEDAVVEDLVYRQAITVIAGIAGTLKSTLVLKLCDAVSKGERFLGRQTKRRPVVYINRDDPPNLVAARLTTLAPSDGFYVWTLGQPTEPPFLGASEYERLVRNLREPLLVFDALLGFHQAKENAAEEMAAVMKHLRRLTTAGASILALHHRGKDDEIAYRGSSAIGCAVDELVKLTRQNNQARNQELLLQIEKSRFVLEHTLTLEARLEGTRWLFEDVTIQHHETALRSLHGVIRQLNQSSGDSPNQSKVIESAMEKLNWPKNKVLEILSAGKGVWWEESPGPHNSLLYRLLREG